MTKSIMIKENQRRAEAAENMMISIGRAVNNNIVQLGRDVRKTHELLGVIYDELEARTFRGRWKRIKALIGGKK